MSKGFARNGWPRSSEISVPADFVASATPHTKGSWVEIDASAAQDVCGLVITPDVVIGVTGVDTSMLLDIGIGAAASEVVVVPNVPVGYAAAGVPTFLPIYIPAGTRVAGRIQAAVVSDIFESTVALLFGGRPGSWGGYTIAETIGVNTATSQPTTGDLADNAWDEAVASTTNAYRALTLHICGTGTNFSTAVIAVDVGYGPGGSEQVIGTYFCRTTVNEIIAYTIGPPFLERSIVAGSRLAIRKNGTGDLSAALIGWR